MPERAWEEGGVEGGNKSAQQIWILILPLRFYSCATLPKASNFSAPGVISKRSWEHGCRAELDGARRDPAVSASSVASLPRARATRAGRWLLWEGGPVLCPPFFRPLTCAFSASALSFPHQEGKQGFGDPFWRSHATVVVVGAPALCRRGSSQPDEAHMSIQSRSNPSDIPHMSDGQVWDQAFRNHSIHTCLMEMVLSLQQAVADHITQLATRHQQQDLVPEEQGHNQPIWGQEALLGRLMFQMVNHLQFGATGGQKFQPPCPSEDSKGDVRSREQAQVSKQIYKIFYQLTNFEDTSINYVLSNRGVETSALYHGSFQDYNTYQGNKYHEDKNTLGFINLGTSENKLCTDLLTERLSRSDMNYIDDDLLQYSDWRGQPFLREEVAQFLTYYCKAPAPLDPENVVVLNGCSSVFSALATVLCDPGEAFLVPTPTYSDFVFSAHLYAKVDLVPVDLESQVSDANTHPFQLTVDKLEQALLNAKLEGKKVRGLVLINPQNPLGHIYSQDSLMEYLEFAKKHSLHVIIDEIYMLSVFDESITFRSVLSMESLPDPNKTHMIWGTSKDFGISGFRFGTLYTHNKEVALAMSSFGYLHGISGITQYKLHRLLQDREWIDNVYLPTNHSRLQEAHRFITNELKSSKIPFLSHGSGLYVWISLRKYLDPCTFEEELLLHRRFLDKKLILSCGKTFMCKEPGWFRLVFAATPLLLKHGLQRTNKS
ncbi:probable inactive 1-aminocyclopropane-1-carboxylate synthase-like protein 2 isoform X3 [Camelus ferus]|uniref:Probable inactive 1-aminocyclopropane-1-carboxylate synthase-like protein 2 isoform X3 n=1 Tax=Camelus ferus TaxID=419612 RepID=A0A8B8TRA5_CAMFR|nr:probable inactive 1-aminocyclopropane-1-carboxylate synthase-like protein 2 isoform X3 [Camelus ferus]